MLFIDAFPVSVHKNITIKIWRTYVIYWCVSRKVI